MLSIRMLPLVVIISMMSIVGTFISVIPSMLLAIWSFARFTTSILCNQPLFTWSDLFISYSVYDFLALVGGVESAKPKAI